MERDQPNHQRNEHQPDPESEDSVELAQHLKRHQELAAELAALAEESDRRTQLQSDLHKVRNTAITIVDRHFRKHLRPGLARRFRDKGLESSQSNGTVSTSGDALVRYTELIGDFFVQVLSNVDDPLWKLHSLSQMRSYVATVISHDILDILRRSKRQVDITGREQESGFEAELASRARERFEQESAQLQCKSDYEATLQIVIRWGEVEDEELNELSNIFMLYYVAEMTMADISKDTGVSVPTVSRRLKLALDKVRAELEGNE